MFGYLNVHSHYSLLRGIAKIPNILKKAKEEKCDAVALTDTHNMYGAVEFYKQAKKADIRPILGTTLFVKHADDHQYRPVILLAKNKSGYTKILAYITRAHFAQGTVPHLTTEELRGTDGDIITVLPALHNRPQQALLRNDEISAERYLKEYGAVFGADLYIGISPQNPTPKNSETVDTPTASLLEVAKKTGVKPVFSPLVYLTNGEEAEAREVLFGVQRMTLSHLEEEVFEDPLLFPKREESEVWCENTCPDALKNLSDIIEAADWEFKIGNWVFPDPPLSDTRDRFTILREQTENGYGQRGLEKTEEIEERVKFELGVIADRGYVDYFLIVIDLIRHMHSRGILTTTRGSAAGSMVSYLSGITNINPIEYQLPFERFLNPHRPTPPDIDIDIADDRRDEVIAYITERYGKEKVAQIGTLGTMMARAAVRDTARALGHSYLSGDRIARLIPPGVQGNPMFIEKAMEEVKELHDLYTSDETVRHIVDVAKKIEGNARHISTHAAGIVISPTTVAEYTPLERDPKKETDHPITQYDMRAIEDAGLVKFDILGLTNLAILSGAVSLVKRDRDKNIDVEKIPIDDAHTYRLIARGYTIGVFQLGGTGMTTVLRRMKPTVIHDLAAVIALYRPGPMRNIDEYIDRKQGRKSAVYLHPDMKKFLRNSYGVLVYQDDLLYTAIELAGYDWKEVDVFRKAVGKKIPELMASQEKIFKERVMKKKNLPRKRADDLWNLFDPFKGYGFNKAHAMSYARVAYQTAYMKTHYPAQYMTAHLSAAAGDVETVSELVYESRRLGLTVLPPDIHKSVVLFNTEKNGNRNEDIRIGLSGIKQAGRALAGMIVSEREKGSFSSLADFLIRMAPHSVLNRRNMEALVKVGVFDCFEKRQVLLENIELLLQCMKEGGSNAGQGILFSAPINPSLELKPAVGSANRAQELYWEKEHIGVYASGHPLTLFRRDGVGIGEVKRKSGNSKVMFTAVITGLKPFRNKNGEKMYFITLEDEKNEKIEAACFPKEAESNEELLALYRPVVIKGNTALRNDEVTVRIDAIENPAVRSA